MSAEDDDGFDWEAAVREIDAACQSTSTATSSSNTIHHHPVSNITNLSFITPKYDNININRKKKKNKQSALTTYFRSETNRSIEIDNHIDFSSSESRACSVQIDTEAAKTWIYPVSDRTPLRDYQFSITKTALFSNTLVAVPTGLGKTFIAAVVMYNYFRWFPQGKIVFAAPSRPLVTQQKEACHKIVGIPLECTIDLTGTTSPKTRAGFWKSKRVFFVTPQVLEKDIDSGKCIVNSLVCLVIDEAHRAQGKYSYSVVAHKLMDIPVQLRIIALTATPGSKQQTIQQIIDNLHISTLEYRTESDPDVSMYVHNRKIDLVEVAMDQDAPEISNLLCEVVRPYMNKLSAVGVPFKNFLTLSPPDFLQARDKFRAAPPAEVAPTKYGEFEGYFGILITIYHIHKLLSSHGIRSAYKMLVEKIQKGGSFARLTSKTEALHKAKHQMSKSISRGMPSTKISKLIEILTCHFQKNNPQRSRVIIFSNFRESVSEIMIALGEMGEDVKATEFIGQSAGKTSKGQSQKVQQAVLEKFRSGGYNVIVATSIGEEGLDIMEVDLVICFDANISPLRMIQRMGRTGRKHDGRVVVLAYEGSELKGYNRKQANSKNNGKHMLNGGINSFKFHSSPRMVSHVFKPEVQFVELIIEQFVHREQRAADDNHINQRLMVANALADAEKELITQYFHPNGEKNRRLSLIAFPHFQAFPSRVHQVMHSSRTGILIDAMQHLQEVSISEDSRILVEDGAPSGHVSEDLKALSEENLEPHIFETSPKSQSQRNVLDLEESSMKSFPKTDEHNTPGFNGQKTFSHSYLFGSDFVSVDALGKVIIISVPFLRLKEISNLKYASRSNSKLLNCKHDYKAPTSKANNVVDLTDSSNARCTNSKNAVICRICHQEALLDEGEVLDWRLNHMENKSPIRLANDLRDIELSPRLTNLIKSGVVPESPLCDGGLSDGDGKEEFLNLDIVSPAKMPTELLAISLGGVKMNNLPGSAYGSDFPNCEEGTNPTNNSCSKDWLLNSQDGPGSIKQRSKYRRLRKLGDSCKRSTKCIKTSGSIPKKHCRGLRKPDVRVFIEDEAEVSSDASQSDDEEDEEDDSCDPSFIDDRLHPTAASPQTGPSGIDMMAIYRRSLLSQSPMERASNSSANITPDSVAHISRSNGSGSCSGKTPHLFYTPKTESEHDQSAQRNSALCQTNPPDTTLSESMLCKTSLSEKEITDTRKRKLSFYQMGSAPAVNLIEKFSCQSEGSVNKQSSMQFEPEADGDVFYDDEFYDGLDLDAVEAEATMLLSYKSRHSIQKQEKPPDPAQNHAFLGSPSFDLGI